MHRVADSGISLILDVDADFRCCPGVPILLGGRHQVTVCLTLGEQCLAMLSIMLWVMPL